MLVGGHGRQASPVDAVLQQKLASSEKITARVLGLTRQGLSVSIGQDTFQLTAPSKLASAKTLTLQAAGTSPLTNGEIKIVAKDEQPLEKPILAKLTSPTPSKPSAVGPIVQRGELEVNVAPLNSEGKITGPSLSVRLQTVTSSGNGAAPEGGPTAALDNGTKTPQEPSRAGPTPAGHQEKPVASFPSQSVPNSTIDTRSHPSPTPSHRVLEQIKPGAPTRDQALVDEAPHAKPSRAIQAEGLPVTKTEAKGGAPASFVTSATSLLSGLKHAIVGGNEGPDAVHLRQPVAPSLPMSGHRPAEDAGLSKGLASASHPVEPTRQSAPQSILASSTSVNGSQNVDPNRGLTTTAVVVAHAPSAKVVLEAKGQLFRVEQSLDLPIGTTLQATFSSSPVTIVGTNPAGGSETRVTLLNQLIDILDGIDQASRYGAQAGDSEPKRQLPLPNHHLASRLLNLMSLEDGTFAGTDPSSSARQDMPTEVQKDQIQTLLRDLRGMSAEPLAEGWKSTTLPLGHDQGQAVIVFVRDQPLDPDDHGSSHDAEPEQIQRAVFDVSLSELGRCQIDVLCQDKRFDFLMRSDRVLPSKNQQTISALFRSACDIAGVTGEINFKVGDFFEPTPPPTPPSKDVMT